MTTDDMYEALSDFVALLKEEGESFSTIIDNVAAAYRTDGKLSQQKDRSQTTEETINVFEVTEPDGTEKVLCEDHMMSEYGTIDPSDGWVIESEVVESENPCVSCA